MNINLLGLISTAKNVIIIRTIAAKRLFITAPCFFWRSETLSVSDTSWAIIRSLSVWLNGVNCVAHSLAQNRIWVIHSNIFFYTIPIWSQSESDIMGERGYHKEHKQILILIFLILFCYGFHMIADFILINPECKKLCILLLIKSK